MSVSTETKSIGRITQIIGPVLDVTFPAGKMPNIYNAIAVRGKNEAGQEIAAKHYIRPSLASVAAKHKADFKQIDLFSVDEVFGGWTKAQKTHFADGGTFDSNYTK